jgi:hypothetical protein
MVVGNDKNNVDAVHVNLSACASTCEPMPVLWDLTIISRDVDLKTEILVRNYNRVVVRTASSFL